MVEKGDFQFFTSLTCYNVFGIFRDKARIIVIVMYVVTVFPLIPK